MSLIQRTVGDIEVTGTVTANALDLKTGAITDAMIAAAAGIAYTKVDHLHKAGIAQGYTPTAADQKGVVGACRGLTGTIVRFYGGSNGKCGGDSTVTLDLLKGTDSVLSSAITLNSSSSSFPTVYTATVSTTALTVGDNLVINIDATAGTSSSLATGVYAFVDWAEDAA